MFGFGKKGDFPQKQLIPTMIKLGEYLKKAYEHRINLRAEHNMEIDEETLAKYLGLLMNDWNPCVDEKPVLDKETKAHLAKFLAGVACNLTKDKESC